jgi:hypothetical protein
MRSYVDKQRHGDIHSQMKYSEFKRILSYKIVSKLNFMKVSKAFILKMNEKK